ncbi:cytochrome c [Marinobacter orientalis]|uniref:Cytochrome c n=1 Tax=Marinobacter orientalis TaxID=1928859 RepID=A0A7Y0NJW0_9GAMM|nr:cytochrome c [Marinobacter orientalis]NMT62061.1 cytochrome c [Marinobacter orientalis]
MTARTGKFLAAVLLGLTVSTSSLAAEPVTPKLTDKLSQLLQKEMRAVQGGMASIHSAMVMGQHETVAENAQQIHDSFILQQELTEEDRKDLMSAVPKGFIKLDKEFHKLAASLAEAGRNEDTKEQHKLFSKMTGNCIQCHSKYVSDRFPGVKSVKE